MRGLLCAVCCVICPWCGMVRSSYWVSRLRVAWPLKANGTRLGLGRWVAGGCDFVALVCCSPRNQLFWPFASHHYLFVCRKQTHVFWNLDTLNWIVGMDDDEDDARQSCWVGTWVGTWVVMGGWWFAYLGNSGMAYGRLFLLLYSNVFLSFLFYLVSRVPRNELLCRVVRRDRAKALKRRVAGMYSF